MIPTPTWLEDAVIYEIYPQSFNDSNGDGIGDLRGVIEKLDYLEWLGITLIWFNPCFTSPFRDAGYDVSDYLTIARRYGSNDDMVELIDAAKERGIRVLLDLVAGHTSIDHAWFKESAANPADHRYIWTDRPGHQLVHSPGPRHGWYLKNFFDEQPALNFGYARLDPDEPWRQLPDAPGPQANRQAQKEIIGYWIDRGVAGFRVDMAFSLVKDDPDLAATTALWRDIRSWLRDTHPGAVLIPESDEGQTPNAGQRADFDADFALVIHPEHSALFNNGGAGILPWQETAQPCDFDPDVDTTAGTRALDRFLELWNIRAAQVGPDRALVLPSSDHDFSRLACGPRSGDQLRAAFTFLLTWGTIPSIYYGDEIGMRYLTDLPDREGSIWNPRFNRAGCRTPMQWDRALVNDGFSSASPTQLYLPQDPGIDRPTVAAQFDDAGSLLQLVRNLIHLRRETPALGTHENRTVLASGYPFVYLRGDSHLMVVNPHREAVTVTISQLAGIHATGLIGDGVALDGDRIDVHGFGYGIFALRSDASARLMHDPGEAPA